MRTALFCGGFFVGKIESGQYCYVIVGSAQNAVICSPCGHRYRFLYILVSIRVSEPPRAGVFGWSRHIGTAATSSINLSII